MVGVLLEWGWRKKRCEFSKTQYSPGIDCPGEKSSSGGEALLVPLTIWPEGDNL